MAILFFVLLFLVFYAYLGYFFALKFFALFLPCSPKLCSGFSRDWPFISIIVAAFDEEKRIGERIEDILAQQYPGRMEIIVASDGSKDNTVAVAGKYENKGVRVLDFKNNRGKALTHNDAVMQASGQIVVVTDAATKFGPDFLKEITAPFADPAVGCTVGRLFFGGRQSVINQAEGFYWKWEIRIRRLEDCLGILLTGSGACMAFRKNLFKRLNPVDDTDFATTIDVVKAGFAVRQVEKAIAYDEAPSSLRAEFNGRLRSSKRLVGTINRWGFSGWYKHPLASWGLLSHKLLRWFSPFFLLGAFLVNASLWGQPFFGGFLALWAFGLFMVILGFICHLTGRRLPLANLFFGFFLANAGFMAGMILAATGRAPVKFKMPE